MKTEEFEFNGYKATVILPNKPNGKWIWKTEFLYAFDEAERTLLDRGYTRVYYQISDKFGSLHAVGLMFSFYQELRKRYPILEEKCVLFGFSRGALYAFNYAIEYPNCVEKMYLDAPVLNLKSWPPKNSENQALFFKEYGLTEQSFAGFADSPIDKLFRLPKKMPILLIAGDTDNVVPFEDNGKYLVAFCEKTGRKITVILKAGCGHHPHSLEDVAPIIKFVEK